ncbi:MAG: hypothetical protein AABZ41_06855 [Bacteroidota bacterium]
MVLLDAAFSDFITGRGVERVKLELTIEGRSVVQEFLVALEKHNFTSGTVAGTLVQPGERVPAFFIKDSTVFFGWVFWEKFTEMKLRKLWGSSHRNKKGDWAIQIPSNKATTIYTNLLLKVEMDLNHPV